MSATKSKAKKKAAAKKSAKPKKTAKALRAAPTRAKAKTAARKAPKRVAKVAKRPAAKKKPAAKKLAAKKPVAKKPAAAKKVLAKKPAAAKKAKAAKPHAAAKSAKNGVISRRDGAGHLDPKYAADLRERILAEKAEEADGQAFLSGTRSEDSLTEELGEEYVEGATSGEGQGGEARDERVPEEAGGPFVITNGGTEFAEGTDESNPSTATREPFPKT